MKKYEKIFRKSLLQILLEASLIEPEAADQAQQIAADSGDLYGEILIDMGLVMEADIVREISKRFQLPYLDLPRYHILKGVVEEVPARVLNKHHVIPVDRFGDTLAMTLSQGLSVDGFREVQTATTLEVVFYVSKITDVQNALSEYAPFDAKTVKEDRRRKAATTTPNTWTDIFDTANKNVMKGLTRKTPNPFQK
jgi:type IV pilus assembly protein PilB